MSISEIYQLQKVSFKNIPTRNPDMKRCLDAAAAAAPHDMTVLILGENGTGKNLLAQAIHNSSPRAMGPYIALNCSAIADTLIESELFGHERGSFTSADRDRKGKFELANGGTLFLDEVGDLSPAAQAKILRAVEYKQFERVGGEKTIKANIRIIAATNQDIFTQVETGTFRRDLFYRLKEVIIELPPLHSRKEDIPLLVERFIEESNKKYNRTVLEISDEALEVLIKYHWPGNIRELRSVIKSAVVKEEGPALLPERIQIAGRRPPPRKAPPIFAVAEEEEDLSLAAYEKKHIGMVLGRTSGNKRKACQILKISRPTLDRKIELYGIEFPGRSSQRRRKKKPVPP
ncbi:MAG: sigma 54-interacting transcriptional regulator [Planctomycetota bacterium]|nr:sigma 54-interacting transcriptional regulator [Planctomycetota bacterium]